MTNEIVQTKTQSRVLIDHVYHSPVDVYEVRIRRLIGLILMAFLFLFVWIAYS